MSIFQGSLRDFEADGVGQGCKRARCSRPGWNAEFKDQIQPKQRQR